MSKKLGIKKNDTVVVIAGTDKKKSGKVIMAMPDSGKVIVEGVNIMTKHKKARSAKQQSGIMHQEASISVSNVMLLCDSCKKATRAKIEMSSNGEKIRVCKKCGAEFDKK